MNIGFTGTRKGMTEAQKNTVRAILQSNNRFKNALHGDCVGADADFDEICKQLGLKRFSFPSNMQSQRAYTEAVVAQPPKNPLSRNKDIVDCSTFMIACPGEFKEALRSGTWATIRYSRKKGKPMFLIFPDGTVSEQERR